MEIHSVELYSETLLDNGVPDLPLRYQHYRLQRQGQEILLMRNRLFHQHLRYGQQEHNHFLNLRLGHMHAGVQVYKFLVDNLNLMHPKLLQK